MAHWQMLNQLWLICFHYSLVFPHCLVDSRPFNFSLLQVKAREHKTLYFPQPESCGFNKALIWNILNVNHGMGISAFFKKLLQPRSCDSFHTALHCSCRLEQQGSWHSFLPRECAEEKKISWWHHASRAVLFHSSLQPAIWNMCQMTPWGEGRGEKNVWSKSSSPGGLCLLCCIWAQLRAALSWLVFVIRLWKEKGKVRV